MKPNGWLITWGLVVGVGIGSGALVYSNVNALVVCQNKKNPNKVKLRGIKCKKKEVMALNLAACCPLASPICLGSVDPKSPFFRRFEAPSAANDCAEDAECFEGGCSREICAAEPLGSTCEVLPEHPAGHCGCVEGVCIWNECGE